MSRWITPDLHVKSLPRAGQWETTQELKYERNAIIFKVPVGFQTDLASIPRMLRWRFTVNGKSRRAAVLHDYLYSTHFADRATCDQVFKSALRDCGVNKYNAWVMWTGVRAGGWTRGRW